MCKIVKIAEGELLNLSQELRDADLNVKNALNADVSGHNLVGEALRHFLEADAVAVEIKRKIRRLRSETPRPRK